MCMKRSENSNSNSLSSSFQFSLAVVVDQMKFGIRIIREAYPQWKEHYLHYNDLKKLISLAAFAKTQLQDKSASAEKVNHKLRADIFKEKWKELQSLIHHVDSRVGNIEISSGSSEDEKVVVRVRTEDGNVGSQSKGLESISKDFPKQVSSRLLCRYFFFILNRELRSIVQFAKLQAEKIKERINVYVEAKLDESVAFRNQDGQDEKAEVEVQEEGRPGSSETKIDTEKMKAIITAEITRLAAFIELNYTGFYKIVKKFDKKVNRHSLRSFMKQLDASQLMLNLISSIDVLWRNAEDKFKTFADPNIESFGVLSPQIVEETKKILDAAKASKMALETVNPGNKSSHHTDQIVLNLRPMLAPMINDSSFAESNIRILETKIEMFGSLMNLFAENIGTVDPDVSLSVEQLCNAYCLLFGVKGRRDRTIVKNYEDSSDEEERAAETRVARSPERE